MCAFTMLIIFQYINYKYILLFSDDNIYGTSTQEGLLLRNLQSDNQTANITNAIVDEYKDQATTSESDTIDIIISSINEYVDWSLLCLMFSAALIFQVLLKLLFNICSRYKIGFDKWTIMDFLCAVFNIAAVLLIMYLDPEVYLDPDTKDMVDYFMIFVLCLTWLRFFTYFLVVKLISQLLLTLLTMIWDTLSFMFLVGCFILIMASIYTTLFQNVNPELYGGFGLTSRALFDSTLGNFELGEGNGDRELTHTILTIGTVFFSNVMLLNYLIAILSTTYNNMRETGIFKYKCNLFYYCERYSIAFSDLPYGEMVLHPPPLSYLTIFMILFTPFRGCMVYVSKFFSYLMFWIENSVFVFIFFILELIIMPLAYLKIWFNIIKNSLGVIRTILNCLIFAILGVPIMFFIVLRDFFYLMKILCMHQGCRYGRVDELQNECELNNIKKLRIYNQTRITVIILFKRLKKYMQGAGEEEPVEEEEDDLDFDPDFYHVEVEDNMNEDYLY